MSSTITYDCPRCGAARMTFDVLASNMVTIQYRWMSVYELFSVCRRCLNGSILVAYQREVEERLHNTKLETIAAGLDPIFEVKRHVSLSDRQAEPAPEHLPASIMSVYNEATKCLAVECPNAAGTMFRLAVDLATTALLPAEDVAGLNAKTRRDLGLRLPWLIANGRLPESLRDLSNCIKEDGNDGAHRGTLTSEDAEDLHDFCKLLLERLYTEPRRLELAAERRGARREAAKTPPKT